MSKACKHSDSVLKVVFGIDEDDLVLRELFGEFNCGSASCEQRRGRSGAVDDHGEQATKTAHKKQGSQTTSFNAHDRPKTGFGSIVKVVITTREEQDGAKNEEKG